LSGANPHLFERVRSLDVQEEAHRAADEKLAERIGEQMVPDPALSREDRAHLLAVRRKLHRGDALPEPERERLLSIAKRLSSVDSGLLRDLDGIADRDRDLVAMAAEVRDALIHEQDRLLRLPDNVLHDSAVASALLPVADRVGNGPSEPPSPKQRRHRSEHAWRRITRAATSCTPRDWLSHVALLPVRRAETARPPAVTARFVTKWIENVRSRRRALATPPFGWPQPDSLVAVNPLHWNDDGHLVSVVLDQYEEPTQVSVRNTSLLLAIYTALSTGAHSFEEVAADLDCITPVARSALAEFVRHLVSLGILQAGEPPHSHLVTRADPGHAIRSESQIAGSRDGWLDVYRYAETGISARTAIDLQGRLVQALRLLALLRDNAGGDRPAVTPDDSEGWLFTDILRSELQAGEPRPPRGDSADGWSPPASAGSAYGRLIRELEHRVGPGSAIEIDPGLLDDLGAPEAALIWPIDCLLRLPAPNADFVAVLDQVRPAGVLDARFIETLTELHGTVPHAEAYRAFLQQLEDSTGVQFVELLAPPLADGAANAVRRPVYTRAWTGDPHSSAYLRADARVGQYIPLQAIRIRRIDGSLRADVEGRPIWPVYHATRSFSPPWDRLARILLATAPSVLSPAYPGADSFLLSPDQRAAPRVTVRGVVVFPAQWRLSANQLWDTSSPTIAKLRALTRLRDRLSLPRWLYLMTNNDTPPVPLDLESLDAIRALERNLSAASSIRAIEMLPAPDQLLVADQAHRDQDRLVSEVQLRLPVDETATAMATRIAPDILAAFGLPGRTPARSRSRSTCRAPPAFGTGSSTCSGRRK
jgi:hypothetical protein